MHLIFMAARIYPFWGIPVAIVLGQLGVYFNRRQSPIAYLFFILAIGLVVTAGAWIFFRGDLYSDRWIRFLIQ